MKGNSFPRKKEWYDLGEMVIGDRLGKDMGEIVIGDRLGKMWERW